jgi:hypothetical protein
MSNEYGTPLGTETPGSKRPERARAKEPTVAERRAALKSLEARGAGEARRSNVPGRGTSSSRNPVTAIWDKKNRDLKTTQEGG